MFKGFGQDALHVRDVGLSHADDVEGNIYAYDFDQRHTDRFVSEVMRDFFETYGDAALPNGAPAMILPHVYYLVAVKWLA